MNKIVLSFVMSCLIILSACPPGPPPGPGPVLPKPEPKTDPQPNPLPHAAHFPDERVRLADKVYLVPGDAAPVDRDLSQQYVSMRAYAYIGKARINDSQMPDFGKRFLNYVVGSSADAASVVITIDNSKLPLFGVARGQRDPAGNIDPNKFSVGTLFGERIVAQQMLDSRDLRFTLELHQGKEFDSRVINSVFAIANTIISAFGGPPAGLVAQALTSVGEKKGQLDRDMSVIMSSGATFKHSITFSPSDLSRIGSFYIVFYEDNELAKEVVKIEFVLESTDSAFGQVNKEKSPPRLVQYRSYDFLRKRFLPTEIAPQPNDGTLGKALGLFDPAMIQTKIRAETDRGVFENYCDTMRSRLEDYRFNSTDFVYAMHAALAEVKSSVGDPEDRSCPSKELRDDFAKRELTAVGVDINLKPLNDDVNKVLDKVIGRLKGPSSSTFVGSTSDFVSLIQREEYYQGLKVNESNFLSARDLDKLFEKRPAKYAGDYDDKVQPFDNYWRKTFRLDFEKEGAGKSAMLEVLTDFEIVVQPGANNKVPRIARLTFRRYE